MSDDDRPGRPTRILYVSIVGPMVLDFGGCDTFSATPDLVIRSYAGGNPDNVCDSQLYPDTAKLPLELSAVFDTVEVVGIG